MFSLIKTPKSTESFSALIQRLGEALRAADTVLVGAGAGLSAAAGLSYDGARFREYFADFADKYGIRDMYSGGFYPFASMQEYWAWWSRQIYCNRYLDPPGDVYAALLRLLHGKDYFVLTTNVDHQFQRAGFDKKRLFYTQGDYGLLQCSAPCCQKTYDNEQLVRRMLAEQRDMRVPQELVPRCPVCGRPMTMNLRCDDTFVQDEGWYAAHERYADFLRRHKNQRLLLLELGVGNNTPVIIKYPFWKMAAENPAATYASINAREACAPQAIAERAICIRGDLAQVIAAMDTQRQLESGE